MSRVANMTTTSMISTNRGSANIPGLQKVIVSALLVIFINDFIKGTSIDIISPILNYFIPGSVKKPYNLKVGDGEIPLYLTRMVVRIINLTIALLVVYAIYNYK